MTSRRSACKPYNLLDARLGLPLRTAARTHCARALADRAGSRLLHLNRQSGDWQDRKFREFPDLLRPDDLLVLNNTRVFPARLYGHRSGQRAQPLSPQNPAARDFLRGRIEVLLTRQVADDPNDWECLVRPGRKIGIGEKLYFGRCHEDWPSRKVARTGSRGHRTRQFRRAPHPLRPCPRFLCPHRAHRTRAASSLHRPRRPGIAIDRIAIRPSTPTREWIGRRADRRPALHA